MQWQAQSVWIRPLGEVNGKVNDEAVLGLSELLYGKDTVSSPALVLIRTWGTCLSHQRSATAPHIGRECCSW